MYEFRSVVEKYLDDKYINLPKQKPQDHSKPKAPSEESVTARKLKAMPLEK